jgi:PEP-CTERM motif
MQLNKIHLALVATVVTLFALGITTKSARAQNLVVDGGFEIDPTTIPNSSNFSGDGYAVRNVGQTFGGLGQNAWTVVQQGIGTVDVAVTSSTQYIGGFLPKTYYNGAFGAQWLDLSGGFDNGLKVGVQQSIATTPGTQYELNFYMGSWFNQVSALELNVDGAAVGNYSYQAPSGFPSYNGDGVAGSSWSLFSYNFTATGTTTPIAFYNLAPAGNSVNGIDNVSVTAIASAAAPEPGTLALLALGGTLVIVKRRRRK